MGQIQTGVEYVIMNKNSGLTWAVQNDDRDPGTSVVQFQTNPGSNQRWVFEKVKDGYKIRTSTKFNGFYAAIDKDRGSGDNNAGVNVYPAAQMVGRDVWVLSSDITGEWINITNASTGKYCDVLGDSTGNNAYIVQYDKNNQSDQLWVILPG